MRGSPRSDVATLVNYQASHNGVSTYDHASYNQSLAPRLFSLSQCSTPYENKPPPWGVGRTNSHPSIQAFYTWLNKGCLQRLAARSRLTYNLGTDIHMSISINVVSRHEADACIVQHLASPRGFRKALHA